VPLIEIHPVSAALRPLVTTTSSGTCRRCTSNPPNGRIKERQEEDVPAAGDKYDSGEQQSLYDRAQPRYRSSVYGSRLPAFARPRLIM
jgi:hypothetical protein